MELMFEGSSYYETKIRPHSASLRNLYNELVAPLKKTPGIPLNDEDIEISVAIADTESWLSANKIVNYSYNSMYLADKGYMVDIADDDKNRPVTFIARNKKNPEIVLGTHRLITGDSLDVFRLFDSQGRWPHQTSGSPDSPAELSRLSFHPFIDALAWDLSDDQKKQVYEFRKRIWQKLWVYTGEFMENKGVGVSYLVLAPHVLKFLRRNGLDPVEVIGVQPAQNQFAKDIREKFKEYWKPGNALGEQPKVYMASKKLLIP